MASRIVTAAKRQRLPAPTRYPLFEPFVRQAGLPLPVREYAFWPGRRFRFDFAWVDAKCAVEVEGGIWSRGRHTRGAGFLRDTEKYNHAAVEGWCVIRVTPQSLCTFPTLDLIRRGLAR